MLTAVMLVVVGTVSFVVHLYSIGYMAEDQSRPRFFAFLSLFTFAMLMLVTADNLVQMFFGWEGVGLASYLLIGFWYERPSANAAAIKAFVVNRVGDFGFALGIFLLFALTGSVGLEQIFAAAPGMAGKTIHLWGDRLGRADHRLPAAVHGRDGQVGAVPAAHLAARRDGGPDPGLRPHPRRDHGDRRRVHGGAAVAAVRPRAERARGRDDRRRDDGVLRRHRRPGAERHQAGHRLFDLLAARLHVRRPRRRRLQPRHFPSVHPRLLQGAAVPRRRLGHHRDAPRAGHAGDGRPAHGDPVHLLDDDDRHAGADRRRHSVHLDRLRRLRLQGRDHRGVLRFARIRRDLRLRLRHARRRPDLVLFVAAGVHDLLRQARRLGGVGCTTTATATPTTTTPPPRTITPTATAPTPRTNRRR